MVKDKFKICKVIAVIFVVACLCFLSACENISIELDTEFELSNVSMPILNIVGEVGKVTKDNAIEVSITYKDENQEFAQKATIKYQGSSSLGYDKKNYTIKFDKKVKFLDLWGKQKKYCLKANYIDYSQARNVVSANIYGQISKTRELDDEFSSLVNGGAIDGFPVVLCMNGSFYGLYTLNIPKDEWLFEMDSTNLRQAILMGYSWTNAVSLYSKLKGNFSKDIDVVDGVKLEYSSTEKAGDYDWIAVSFNNMVDFLSQDLATDQFKENVGNFVNVERAIGSMLFTQFIYGADNCAKNILWVTYNGSVWTPCVYDLDDTWGLVWDGKSFYNVEEWLPSESSERNLLWERLYVK